jgi:hypothetical protein
MQDLVTPILEAALVCKGLHDTGRMIARLNQVAHNGAAVINENLVRIRAVEIDLGHVQLPLNKAGGREISALPPFSTTRQQNRKR